MTALVARQPLQPLSMSSIQRGSRRLSARLQEKDGGHDATNGAHSVNAGSGNSGSVSKRGQTATTTNNKKRKNGESRTYETCRCAQIDVVTDYDEEDDGFTFTRVQKKKPRGSEREPVAQTQANTSEPPKPAVVKAKSPLLNDGRSEPPKKPRNRLSFGTPDQTQGKPVRRSKRLSRETNAEYGSPPRKIRREASAERPTNKEDIKRKPPVEPPALHPTKQRAPKSPEPATELERDEHSATKISLPLSDTPVINRNKAMRQGKSGKSERRSSLGFRGRRASSLIETGNSNGQSKITREWRNCSG